MKLEVLALLLAFSGLVCLNGQVNGQTFELFKQYYECRNLTMILNGQTYVRDTSLPDNYLDDSFYQRLGLANMTYDQGMNLIKKIYTDTRNCTTRFCNCVNWGFIDGLFDPGYQNINNNYSIFFRNESNYPGVRSIVSEFYNETKWNLQSLNSIFYSNSYSYYDYGVYRRAFEYPSIIKFLLVHDFTRARLRTLRYPPSCSGYDNSQQIYEACTYINSFADQTVFTNATNLELENQMVCELIRISRGFCSRAYQRIETIWMWAERFSKLKYTGSSLIAYFDNLLHRAKTYTSSFELKYQQLYTGSNYIQSYGYKYFYYSMSSSEMSFVCLNSSEIRIDSQSKIISDRYYGSFQGFSWFNFTFFTNSGSILEYNFNTTSYPNTNGTIFKDSNDESVFQVFTNGYYNDYNHGIIIYHFETKSKIVISKRNGFTMYSSRSFFDRASGYLVGVPIDIDTSVDE